MTTIKPTTPVTLKLPAIVEVRDYHEFKPLENLLRGLTKSKRLKVEEYGVGMGTYRDNYVGIVYTRKDKEYKKLVETLRKEAEE